MAAPVTAITAHDTKFYELLPRLFPHADAKAWFVGNEAFANDRLQRRAIAQGEGSPTIQRLVIAGQLAEPQRRRHVGQR